MEQHLVLMCQADAPKKVPSFYRKRLGKYKQRIDFEMVRLWELDPERAFELAHPALLPWVLVMRANQAQWRKP